MVWGTALGVFIGGGMLGLLAIGVREYCNHMRDEDVPAWAHWCVFVPGAWAAVMVYLLGW